VFTYSYEEALQTLADSEAKRETVDKELRLVSTRERERERGAEGEEWGGRGRAHARIIK
jgi:hypothetical protein